MKCPNCGEDLFEGQFRCHKCGKLVEKSSKEKDKGEKANG